MEEDMQAEIMENVQDEDADETLGAADDENKKEGPTLTPRFAPHPIPEWNFEEMRERYTWNIRIYPVDREDCKNSILNTVTNIAEETWYHVPRRERGPGYAELCISSTYKAHSVMAKILYIPFYYRYITVEMTRRTQDGENGPYKNIVESASLVFDSAKCERIKKNTTKTRGSQKRRRLWIRYLPENTTTEILRVVFPMSQNSQIEQHNSVWIGMVETPSRPDVIFFIKTYITVVINGVHILAVQNKEVGDHEDEIKAELEKNIVPLANLEQAPIIKAFRYEDPFDNSQSARALRQKLNQQQHEIELKRASNKRGEGLVNKSGGGGGGRNWRGDRDHDRSRGGGRYSGGGGGGYGGYPAGYSGLYGADEMAEMMMMHAQLNETIQNQLMMLNPGGGGSGMGHYGGGGRQGGGGRYGGGQGW